MILITGGAGFIGNALLHRLNANGQSNIMVADSIGDSLKWRLIIRQFNE